MLGLEPPKMIAFQPRRKERRSSKQQPQAQRDYSRQRPLAFDYMEAPSSMANNPLRPIFPWEVEETHIRQNNNNNHNNHKHSNNHNSNSSNHRRQGLNHRPFLAVLFLVTLAFAAGTLLDGDGSNHNDANDNSNNSNSSSNNHSESKKGKERGKLLPAANSKQEGIAKEMFEAYQELQEDYHVKAFHPSHQQRWKKLNEKDGAKVSLLEHESDPSCPYVRMEAIIPTSVASCWDFLSIHNWDWSMPKMDPFYDTHSVHANYTTPKGVNMVLVRKQTHRILAFGKRDFVFLSVTDLPLADGTYVSGSVSVETPDISRTTGYTRAFQDSIAFYKPVVSEETGHEQCHLTIVCRIDLNDSTADGSGGFMPMWLYVKTVGATGLKSVLKMRDALLEMKEELTTAAATTTTTTASVVSEQDDVSSIPTAQSTATPPTPSPVLLENDTNIISKNSRNTMVAANDNQPPKWWNRDRGGAFASVSATPQTATLRSSFFLQQQSQEHQHQWQQPLFGVFTHVPSRSTVPDNKGGEDNKWGLRLKTNHLPWLQQMPFVGKRGIQ